MVQGRLHPSSPKAGAKVAGSWGRLGTLARPEDAERLLIDVRLKRANLKEWMIERKRQVEIAALGGAGRKGLLWSAVGLNPMLRDGRGSHFKRKWPSEKVRGVAGRFVGFV